jgi:hypothetical protein
MIKRNLFRRMEILEEQIIPEGELTILNIVFVDGPTKRVTERLQVTLGAYRPAQGHRRGAPALRTLSPNRR